MPVTQSNTPGESVNKDTSLPRVIAFRSRKSIRLKILEEQFRLIEGKVTRNALFSIRMLT